MPGPAPKPASQRRRRNAAPSSTRLPAAGRSGPPPPWPLGAAPKKGTVAHSVWTELWATPQAVAWERLGPGAVRAVARYARCLVVAERPGASAAILAEVRQMEDRLGLTPMSMLRLRWEIEADEVVEKTPAGVTRIDAYRDTYSD